MKETLFVHSELPKFWKFECIGRLRQSLFLSCAQSDLLYWLQTHDAQWDSLSAFDPSSSEDEQEEASAAPRDQIQILTARTGLATEQQLLIIFSTD